MPAFLKTSYPCRKQSEAVRLGEKFSYHWNQQLKSKNPSLWRALFSCLAGQMLFVLLAQLGETFFKIFGSVVLERLQDDITKSSQPWLIAFWGTLILLGNSLSHAQMFFHGYRLGMNARILLNAVVYNKILSLTISNDSAAGQIVNMVANDVQKVEDLAPFLHFVGFGPIESLIIFFCIYNTTKSWKQALIVLSFTVVITLCSLGLALLFAHYRRRMVVERDELTRNVTDMLTGMQVIKFYSWEQPFIQRITGIRQRVTGLLTKSAFLRATSAVMYQVANDFVLVVLLCCSIHLLNDPNDADASTKVLNTHAIFANVILVVCYMFPRSLELLSEAAVSVDRLKIFLLKPEVTATCGKTLAPGGEFAVIMEKARFRWPSHIEGTRPEDEDALGPVSLTISTGDLVVVVGTVGAAKSVLLNSILGELPLSSGDVSVVRPIAFCSQQPWLLNVTIRENITMGKAFDAEWYAHVLKACYLTSDLQRFPDGDATLAGERGSMLSGGQKARVSLARAMYFRDAELLLLDDVFSAVDNVVGNFLFRSIAKYIQQTGKTCVFVTHQLQYVRLCPKVILMQDEEAVFYGTPDTLLEMDFPFCSILRSYQSSSSKPSEIAQSFISCPEEDLAPHENAPIATVPEAIPPPIQSAEDIEENIDASAGSYTSYFRSGGGKNSLTIIFCIAFCAVLAQALVVIFLEVANSWSNDPQGSTGMRNTLLVFSAEIILFGAFFFAFYQRCLKCSSGMFNRMVTRVMTAPLSHFQQNSQGRILNRFSRDQALVDEVLPGNQADSLHCLLRNISCFFCIVYYNPYSLLFVPLLAFAIRTLQKQFFTVSKQVKSLEASTRSPVYSLLSCTLEGLPLIRCFGVRDVFLEKMFRLQDANTRSLFSYIGLSRWFAFYVDMSCNVFYVSFVFLSIWIMKSLKAENINFAITYCQSLSELVTMTGKLIAELENNMTGVDRIFQQINVESEAPQHLAADSSIPKGWPHAGAIEFRHLSLKYPNRTTPALHNISHIIEPGCKIAIVGETGAGKSSLLTALVRIAEAEGDGMIFVDSLDIRNIGLTTLRQSFSIIPQDPFLFRGDIRFNLDPFSQYTDSQLWQSLESVRLLRKVKRMGGLGAVVLENGANYSTGQRQLICLARAILKENNIIIMDEATANIDLETTQTIQRTIDTVFARRTVCTIAHRLQTIIEYDQVLVMRAGTLIEFGSPHQLLEDEASHFSAMVRELGAHGEHHLKCLARQKYLNSPQ